MLRDSLDAIRGLINSNFPDTTIHVNKAPEKFNRPCFFVALVSSNEEHLNNVMYRIKMTWQIVYFAPLAWKPGQNPDAFNQLTASDTLKTSLMETMTLTGPDGTVYHITDVDGGPRDNEVYITIRLETERTRPQQEYDLMQEVEHVFEEE